MKKLILFTLVILAFTTFGQPVLKVNTGHSDVIKCIAFSPDGKYIASSSSDNTVKLWNTEKGQEIYTLSGHDIHVYTVAFSPDGKQIVSSSATTILWDSQTGKKLKELDGSLSLEMSKCSNFSPDGRFIATGGERYDSKARKDIFYIRLWDAKTNKLLKTFTGHSDDINTVNFNSNGNLIVSASKDNTVRLWNCKTGKLIRILKGHKNNVWSAIFSPDGKIIVSGSRDHSIIIWETNSGKKLKVIKEHTDQVRRLAFNPDGKSFVSTSYDKTIRLWNVVSGDEVLSIGGQTDKVICADFSPDGKYIATGDMDNNNIKLWNSKTGELVRSLLGYTSIISSVNFSPNGSKVLTGRKDGKMFLWNMQNASPEKILKAHNGVITSVNYSPDGKYVVSTSRDKSLKLWNYLTWDNFNTIEIPGDCSYAAFSNDSKTIAASGYYLNLKASKRSPITLWDIGSSEKMKVLYGHDHWVRNIEFSPDGKNILSSAKLLRLWKAKSGKKQGKAEVDLGVWAIASYSPDGAIIGFGQHRNINFLDSKSLKVIKTFKKPVRGFTHNLQFSPSCAEDIQGGKYFIYTNDLDGSLYLLNSTSGKHEKTFKGHTSDVNSFDISPDGKFVVSGSDDGSVKYWDVESGKLLITLYGIKGSEEWVIFTPDGYWDGSVNCGEYVNMVEGLKLWNIDQFAVKNNRPDIILQRLGSQNQELIQFLNKAYKKRLRKLGLSEDKLEEGYHTPDAKILSSTRNNKTVELNIKLNDSKYLLKSYNVFINDVPLFANGKNLNIKSKILKEKVELTVGVNKIEISCMNEKGTESFRDAVYYNFEDEVKGDLYVLALGVSKYKDQTLTLQYAHKDALDLEQVAKSLKGKGFEKVYTKTLVNEQVTTANIKAAKDFVKNAKVDDTFILFIAGHGMHDTDEEATYYYLTHNTDLKNLKGTAATFETIEDLLQGIPPRNKLFLMDACESGELDPEDEVQYLASATEAGVNSRGFKKTGSNTNVIASEAKQSTNRSYLLNRNRYIYNDLVRRSGAIVFSSSKGGELSYERSDIENGLFTEYIMNALTTTEADVDQDGTVSTDELRKYVSAKVAEASDGLQHPTVDRDNIYQKFGFTVQ